MDEVTLEITSLVGGKTTVPKEVMEFLGLRYSQKRRQKLLWSQAGKDVVVKKGTLQSSFRKTILTKAGKAAVPKHILKALELNVTSGGEEKILWVRRGEDIIVRRATL